MTNDALVRDQSKLDYFLAFNDRIVGRIDKKYFPVAALVGIFGILYFSLAPAAMSTEVVTILHLLHEKWNFFPQSNHADNFRTTLHCHPALSHCCQEHVVLHTSKNGIFYCQSLPATRSNTATPFSTRTMTAWLPLELKQLAR
jgi:hypothetical protein